MCRRVEGADRMIALDIARWQFGIVTVYHFLFVPLTIGLSFLIALMQTVWYRTGNPKYLYMVKFWSKLFPLLLLSLPEMK